MSNPKIGITLNYIHHSPELRFPTHSAFEYNHTRWAEVVYDNGGTPFYLPAVGNEKDIFNLLEHLDGILLAGGGDIDPSFYGEKSSPKCINTSPHRDHFKIEIVNNAIKLNKPLLGICRGMQVINIALGGTIYQDLSDIEHETLDHRNTPQKDYSRLHNINMILDSKLGIILRMETLDVNTSHHQAINKLGRNLEVSAQADDLVIEAVEYQGDNYLLGVEWHPEAMAESPSTRKILKSFLGACKQF